jgi:predicted nucleic acid-binding protein
VLDTGVLGQASHPRRNREFAQWFVQILATDTTMFIAEIADYEVRRELIRAERHVGIARLDALKAILPYLPLTTSIMLRAAGLWAQARRRGRPTADPKELDCDVILAAQALEVGAMVVTDNVGHLALFVEAKSWRDIAATNA